MIITSISFQNFYSFKHKEKMNFLVNDNAPKINHFGLCSENEETRFSKVSSIFGANGSGKTNLILIFEFLRWFISHSFSHSNEGFEVFYPFETTRDKPSLFEVEFYIEKVFYKLSLIINSERVLLEMLESRKNKRLTTLYSRKYVSSRNSYKFEAKKIKIENSFIKKVRPNASVISTARQYNHPELTKVKKHWDFVFGNSLIPSDLDKISEFYSKNEKYFHQVRELLKTSDLGLSNIQIKTKETKDRRGKKTLHFPAYGFHKNKGKTFQLPFYLESGGTQQLYEMGMFIFQAQKKGSVCLIDEIECNLHPNILPIIVNLFTSEEKNPKGAQLICTTHMPTLMADLSKYQIFMVEKTRECESEVYRLDEVEDVRSDDNFPKKYLAGSYGGIPDIDM